MLLCNLPGWSVDRSVGRTDVGWSPVGVSDGHSDNKTLLATQHVALKPSNAWLNRDPLEGPFKCSFLGACIQTSH